MTPAQHIQEAKRLADLIAHRKTWKRKLKREWFEHIYAALKG